MHGCLSLVRDDACRENREKEKGKGNTTKLHKGDMALKRSQLTSFFSMSMTSWRAVPLTSSLASHMLTTPLPAPRSAVASLADEPEAAGPPCVEDEEDAGVELPELRTALEIFQLPQ